MLQEVHSASDGRIRPLTADEINGVSGGVKVIYVKMTRADGSYYFYPLVVPDDYPEPISIA